MRTKTDTTTTVRKLKEDDLARQTVLRYQRNQHVLGEDDLAIRIVRTLAEKTWNEQTLPQTIGAWLALILYYGHTSQVAAMRQIAIKQAQATYIQAHTWLAILDEINNIQETG